MPRHILSINVDKSFPPESTSINFSQRQLLDSGTRAPAINGIESLATYHTRLTPPAAEISPPLSSRFSARRAARQRAAGRTDTPYISLQSFRRRTSRYYAI